MHNDCPWNIRQLHVHYKNFFGPPWSLKRDYEWFLLTQKRDLLAILQALITAFNNLLSRKNGSKIKKWKVNISLLQESIEFRQTALEATLQLVYSIIWELKTHEIIENTVIMQVDLRIHSIEPVDIFLYISGEFSENKCYRNCERECTVDKFSTSRSVIAMKIRNW